MDDCHFGYKKKILKTKHWWLWVLWVQSVTLCIGSMKSYGLSLFWAWANTHGKSMGTYVDLVARTRPLLTLSGCRSRQGLLDMTKLVGKKKS